MSEIQREYAASDKAPKVGDLVAWGNAGVTIKVVAVGEHDDGRPFWQGLGLENGATYAWNYERCLSDVRRITSADAIATAEDAWKRAVAAEDEYATRVRVLREMSDEAEAVLASRQATARERLRACMTIRAHVALVEPK